MAAGSTILCGRISFCRFMDRFHLIKHPVILLKTPTEFDRARYRTNSGYPMSPILTRLPPSHGGMDDAGYVQCPIGSIKSRSPETGQ